MIETTPEAFIFMKVGEHAGEPFEEIIERKNKEYKKAGKIFWGYGGTACHPLRQVQPFAKMQVKKQGSIYLLMEKIDSHADPDILPAKEYSEDGIHWKDIPVGIRVIGSRYALVLNEIKPGDLEICVDNFEVGIGPSRGKVASKYIQGRIDKACLTNRTEPSTGGENKKTISLCAELLNPYAVMLR